MTRSAPDGAKSSAAKPRTERASSTQATVTFERVFTTEGVHPYDEVVWEMRDVVQTNWKTNETVFEQRGVEFPAFWSVNAYTIVTTKYFRGAPGTPQREHSLRQLIDRVVLSYGRAGRENGYFSTERDAEVFEHELTWMLLHQVFSFNSPVWFNVGTASPQQVSACFILSVDDTMDSILNWYREEGLIFKGGSGAGLNLSRIRSSEELLSSGGTARARCPSCGAPMRRPEPSSRAGRPAGRPRWWCSTSITPTSGSSSRPRSGRRRRSASCATAGSTWTSVARTSPRCSTRTRTTPSASSDEFMRAVEEGREFGLRARGTGEVIESVDAKALFRQMAEAAWACATPACSTTTPSTTGTPTRRPVGSPLRTRAPST